MTAALRPPTEDDQVPAFWRSLGLPGLVDVHVHFLPESVQAKVWAFFDRAKTPDGTGWAVHYRWPESDRLARLRALGVRAFPSLVYPHKPGMAKWLVEWALAFAARVPECVPTLTFYPEEDAPAYVADALAAGARIGKAHVQVGDYDPADLLLDPVWGLLAEAGTPVVLHAGSSPVAGRWTGPDRVAEVLRRHPALRLVIAHLGMSEYGAFFTLADRYAGVMLDTTMAATDYASRHAPLPASEHGRLRELGLAGKVLLGTDFPSIPHPYAHQVEALARLDLGDDWLRAVLWDNGAQLLGVRAGDNRDDAAARRR
jgi:hypothetical protein